MANQSELNHETFPAFLYDQGDRIGLLKKILQSLGNPDKRFNIIHICGTNGKGSTSLMIAALLRKMNYHVGLFTSPYIGNIYNGIQVDFKNISKQHFNQKISLIEKVLQNPKFNGVKVSAFEAQFLISMLYFADLHVDYVVLECGLGGELDATNAVFNTMYSIFTKISLDHVGILGNNITEIATTKSKIIRQNNVTISAQHQPGEAFRVLEKEAHSKNATFLTANQTVISMILQTPKLTRVHYVNSQNNEHQSGTFNFGLVATYQLENLATVITWLIDFLNRKKLVYNLNQLLEDTLLNIVVPGRFEKISQQPVIILDGGHNPDGIQAFVKTVNTLYPDSEKLIINGFLKDKSYESSVKELISLKNASFIITEPDNKQRELPPQQLSDVYVKLTKQTYQSFDSPTDAIQYAVSHATTNTIIFVIGSFYLLNPIRTYLLSRSDHHEH